MKNPVSWFEIYVQDMSRARKFYESVLDITLDEMMMPSDIDDAESIHMVAFPFDETQPNSSGALVKATGMDSGGNSVMIYFTCDDCSVEESRVQGSGGNVLKAKFSIGEFGFCSICLDTEGNTFGLHSMN